MTTVGPGRDQMQGSSGERGRGCGRARRRAEGSAPARFALLATLLIVATALAGWVWLDVTKPADLQVAVNSAQTRFAASVAAGAATSTLASTPTNASQNASGAQSGAWAAVESMPAAVWGAGTAVLQDGRVLVVGGTTGSDSHFAVARAAIFDPASEQWSAATSMLQARTYPAVAVLNDGSVLVAGGSRNAVPLDTAERYYPQTGTWVSAGTMHEPRTHATATVLHDGRVLLAGGGTTGQPDYAATASAEIFDPATGSWVATGSMAVARTLHVAALLADGEVLVAGGASVYFRDGTVSAAAELYDPMSGTWRQAAPLSTPRYGASALTLRDGRVLVSGGWSATAVAAQSLASAEVYDQATDTWQAAGPMSDGRAQFRMSELPDGRLVAAGGVSPHNTPLATADLFDPATLSWHETGRLPTAVYWPILATLRDGRVLVAGGARNGSATVVWRGAALYTPPPG